MRPFALALLSALAVPAVQAQIARGVVEVSGSAGLAATGSERAFQLAPTLGYLLTDAVEVGVELNYIAVEGGSTALPLSQPGYRIDQSALTTRPFVAIHFGRRLAATRPFVQAQVGTAAYNRGGVFYGGAVGVKHLVFGRAGLRSQLFALTDGAQTQVGVSAGVSVFL